MKWWIGVLLLLLGILRHLGYEKVAPKVAPYVWNASGALTIAALLVIVWIQNRSPVVGAVVFWGLYEEALVATCSVWRIFDWWPMAEGEQLCNAKFGVGPSDITMMALGALVSLIWRTRSRGPRDG